MSNNQWKERPLTNEELLQLIEDGLSDLLALSDDRQSDRDFEEDAENSYGRFLVSP